MRFDLFLLISLLFCSCAKDQEELFTVKPVTYDIGNEQPADRLLEVTYPYATGSQPYYAEFQDTVKDKNYRGWEFTMLDPKTKIIQTVLKIYRIRKQDESKITFDPGDYFTVYNSALSSEVVVHFETRMNGAMVALRAYSKKPDNFVRITKVSPDYYLVTFDVSASAYPSSGGPPLGWLKGRLLVKRN